MNRRFRLRAIAAIIGSMGTPDTGLIFRAPLQTSLRPTRAAGSATPTFTRATTKRFIDFEGLVRTAIYGEACFEGARRVYNAVAHSEGSGMSDWAWAGAAGSTTPSTTDVTDPLGNNTAMKIVFSGGASQIRASGGLGGTTGNEITRISCWIRTLTGTASVQFGTGWALAGSAFTVDSTWKRYSGVTTAPSNPGGGVGISLAIHATNCTIYVAFAQLEDVTGQSNQNPSEYVSVGVLSAPYHGAGVDGVKYFDTLNGNTVSSNVVTEATGPSISGSGKWAATSGNSGEYFSTPDSAATSIAGDIDIRVKVRMEDWSPSGAQTFYAKDSASGNHRGHWFYMDATALQYSWSPDGTGAAIITKNSDTKPSITDGTVAWVRVTHDVDDGSGNNVVKFYYSLDDGVTWTQHGTTKTTAGTTSQADVNASPSIGANNSGDNRLNGRVYRAIVKNGIDGTTVLDFNPNDYTSGGSWVSSTTGEWWYLNGNAKVFGASAASYTNLAVQSQTTNTNWTKDNVTSIAYGGTAPDGTATVNTLTENTATSTHRIYEAITNSSGATVTLSAYLQAGTRRYVSLAMTQGGLSAGVTVDTTNWTIATQTVGAGAVTNSRITALSGGTYRVDVTGSLTGQTNYNVVIAGQNSATPTDPAGDSYTGTSSTLKYWGFQATVSSDVVGYIPTGASAVTVYGIPAQFDASGPYGYFAEGARTNLALRSQEFDNAAWTIQSVSVSANAVAAPDGTTTADRILESNTAANTRVGVFQTTGVVAAGTYTASVYVKDYSGGRFVRFEIVDDGALRFAYVTINPRTGAITQTGNGSGDTVFVSAYVDTLAGGWFRIRLTATVANSAQYLVVALSDSGTPAAGTDFGWVAYTTTAGSGCDFWGAQLEAASFASSYIPTTTASVTRNADVLTYVSSGNILSSAGALSMEYTTARASLTGGIILVSTYSGGGIPLGFVTNALAMYDGANWRESSQATTGPVAAPTKVAVSWSASAATAASGGTSSAVASFPGYTLNTAFAIGTHRSGAGAEIHGNIRNVNIYGRQLADARLQALTT